MRYPIITLSMLALTLTACSSGEVRDTLGINRKAPDAFTVVSRPPLSVPPEFYLRPPQAGAAGPATISPEQQARNVVLVPDALSSSNQQSLSGLRQPTVDTAVTPVVSAPLATSSEATFLGRAGVERADPDIRSKLYHETYVEPVEAEDTRSPLLQWLDGDESNNAPVVDARAEAERIRANKDAGKPLNEGEVPVENTGDKSVIDAIFN